MARLDFEKSNGQVYVQIHGFVPYWIDLLDDDGRIVGASPTQGEIKVLRLIDAQYRSVFDSLKIAPQQWIAECLPEFRDRVTTATVAARAAATPHQRSTYGHLFAEAERDALRLLDKLAAPKERSQSHPSEVERSPTQTTHKKTRRGTRGGKRRKQPPQR